jgi:hypothetical protein
MKRESLGWVWVRLLEEGCRKGALRRRRCWVVGRRREKA